MINIDDYTNENKIEHNSKWPYIPDHSYRILIVDGSGSGKTNEAKYQYLINKRGKVGLDHFKDPKAFMKYSNFMKDVYKNTENYNP